MAKNSKVGVPKGDLPKCFRRTFNSKDLPIGIRIKGKFEYGRSPLGTPAPYSFLGQSVSGPQKWRKIPRLGSQRGTFQSVFAVLLIRKISQLASELKGNSSTDARLWALQPHTVFIANRSQVLKNGEKFQGWGPKGGPSKVFSPDWQ